ncbi:MAG: hypothetical protein LBB67_04940 [Oscillospiraceae bacterium]|jgi:hypothetical protein|nr:hypothetical protein [Oscillospiraceae bacterium]
MVDEIMKAADAYPWLVILLAVVFALCVFAWFKALKRAKRRGQKKQELIAKLEHEKKLRDDFAVLTQQTLIDTPPARLAEGVCCSIQLWLESQTNLNAAFESLPDEKKMLYALGYVMADTQKSLSHFFRANGKPLTPWALYAVNQLVGGAFAGLFAAAYEAFDEDSDVSLDKTAIAQWDEAFAQLIDSNQKRDILLQPAKDFILANAVLLCECH